MLARVRPFNNYGGAPAGSVVEVTEKEFKRVPWCLELVAETPEKRGELVERSSDVAKSTAPFVEHAAEPDTRPEKLKKRR